MLRSLALLGCVLALAGCATYQPVPQGHTGPTASVRDSGMSEDGTKAQMFALTEIDGHRIANAFGASAAASHGRGASLTPVYPERSVQIRPMKVMLRGSHVTGAPIHAMASQLAGTFFSVAGTVTFTPAANGKYIVMGELKKDKSTVWIEDAETGQAVTDKVTQ